MKQFLFILCVLLNISTVNCQYWFPSLKDTEEINKLLSSKTSIETLEKRKNELQVEVDNLKQQVNNMKAEQRRGGWAAAPWVSENVVHKLEWKQKVLNDLENELNKRRATNKQTR